MANGKQTLVQRIALDGGKEIEKELHAIGAEGDAVFAKLKAGADKLAASSSGVNKFFKQLKSDLDTISKGSKKVSDGFGDLTKGFKEVAKAGAILIGVTGGIVFGLEKMTETASDAADAQSKAAASAGLAIKDYGRLQFAFEQGNVAADQFNAGMKKFNTVLVDAAHGGKASLAIFQSLGVSITDSNGKLRPTAAILEDIANKFAKLPNGAEKSNAAIKLFGKSGALLVPVLNDGGAALRSLGDDAERAGRVFTEAQAVIGDGFSDAKNRLVSSIAGIKNQVGLSLAPAFTTAFDTITKLLQDNQAGILAFAATITDQVIPVIKDFAAALAGNDSAVVNKNIIGIRDGFVKVGQAVLTVIDILGTVFTVLQNTIQPLVDLYNATLGQIFGQIDSQTALITIAILALTGAFKGVGLVIKGVSSIIEGLSIIFGTTTGAIAGMIGRVLLLQGLLKTLVDDMVKSFGDAVNSIVASFRSAVTAIGDFFTGLGGDVKGVIDGIVGAIQAVINLAKQAAGAVSSALGGGGGGSDSGGGGNSFATGGHVRGRGTGTSDSIIARLSNGEFVLKAKAVRRLGVSFLNALNQGRANGFAMGGLVGNVRPAFSVPGFAAGGVVSGGRTPLTLNIGGEEFADLLAPDDVAAKLVQYAMGRKVRSAGKKPSWKKS